MIDFHRNAKRVLSNKEKEKEATNFFVPYGNVTMFFIIT